MSNTEILLVVAILVMLIEGYMEYKYNKDNLKEFAVAWGSDILSTIVAFVVTVFLIK